MSEDIPIEIEIDDTCELYSADLPAVELATLNRNTGRFPWAEKVFDICHPGKTCGSRYAAGWLSQAGGSWVFSFKGKSLLEELAGE
jgi:hypothetical protein